MLHVDHPGDQDAGIADDQAAGLEHQGAAEIVRDALDHRGIGGGLRRTFAVEVIGDAEAAAEIDVADGVAVGAQGLHELGEDAERGLHGAEIGDLAADMDVDAGDLDALHLRRAGVDLAGVLQRNAELVLRLAGRDLGVRAGIDVRVDAHGNAGGVAGLLREARQQIEFGLGLDVEAVDVGCERGAQLGLGLADAGEHDFPRRDAGCQGALQLAAGDDVGAGAALGQGAQHRLIGIGLHGVADQHVLAGEGVREHAVVPLQGGGGIAVERGADGGGE